MIDAVSHDRPTIESTTRVVWLPADRMARYQWAKIIGAAFFVVIFAGWLFIQWSNPTMRLVAIGLLALTLWITLKSFVTDMLRTRGREISVDGGVLRIVQPSGLVETRLGDVATSEWREETQDSLGLWLLDQQGQTLAHIDAAFLADQAEARMFLGWLRERTAVKFEVRWPQVAGV